MKGSWRVAKAWYFEMLAIGEGTASIVGEGPGLKESCRKVEA